ncbi:histidinol-phosphate transaminase [Paenibacillus sp. LMG 31456]|uniref:Histidinol-phosphate aminotransferase n=1 Tax=Paenibacillus foliorum TaxID=2654974 RepID=A0A972GQ99_9BACL|nr:histidinol-phosphate transaminase [Paenibacillus foliorum]NOU91847.1 histidinol-phosphate transaminase [Paenibacillus foliorum]
MSNLKQTHIVPRKTLDNIKPYSPGKPIWEVQNELGLTKVIKLASNENPLGASPKAIDAINSFVTEIHRYPDAGAKLASAAIASKLGIKAEEIIVTNGGDELISLVSEAFLEAGDEIVVPSPSFSEYEFGAHLMGARTVAVPLKEDYQYDVDALLAAVTERTKIMYICSPNNPTGTYIPAADLKRLIEALPEHVLLMVDSAYSYYASADDYTSGMEYVRAGYPVIVLQTFSKIFGLAGIRVGFGAAPEAVIRTILKVKEPFNVNALAQIAAAAAITDEEHVQASIEVNQLGREQLYEGLSELGLSYTTSMSNFVLVELGTEAKSIYDQLLAKGVIVRYGTIWGLPRHIRVTVGLPEENECFLESLKEILG